MADFHSTDGWFIWGIITIILNFAIFSGWYKLSHVLYSVCWPLFSLSMLANWVRPFSLTEPVRIVTAIFSIVLHSRLSTPELLLTTALWNLLGLAVLILAIVRCYVRITIVLNAEQKLWVKWIYWIQYLPGLAIPFFAASTACWAYSDSGTSRRVYFRNAGRILNWTGGTLLVFCFVASLVVGFIIMFWLSKKNIPKPVSTVSLGIIVSAPFVATRLAFQMYWMQRRNSSGAEFQLYAAGSVTMDLLAPIINLMSAWYTLSAVNTDAFKVSHELVSRINRRKKTDLEMKEAAHLVERERKRRARDSMISTFSIASASTMASINRATQFISEFRPRKVFTTRFVVGATGHIYKMDTGNVLIRSAKQVHKSFHSSFDGRLDQPPFHLDSLTIRADAGRAVVQIAKLLWLFTLWQGCKAKNSEQQRAIEVDVISIWYEEISAESEIQASIVQKVRPFTEIKDAVLGSEGRRPLDKMLGRVYLHFFNKLDNHPTETRASACLFALRLMLRKDPLEVQAFEPSFIDASEGEILDIDEAMWHKFDNLAAGRAGDDGFLLCGGDYAAPNDQQRI